MNKQIRGVVDILENGLATIRANGNFEAKNNNFQVVTIKKSHEAFLRLVALPDPTDFEAQVFTTNIARELHSRGYKTIQLENSKTLSIWP